MDKQPAKGGVAGGLIADRPAAEPGDPLGFLLCDRGAPSDSYSANTGSTVCNPNSWLLRGQLETDISLLERGEKREFWKIAAKTGASNRSEKRRASLAADPNTYENLMYNLKFGYN